MNTTTHNGDCQLPFSNISSYGLWENLKSSGVVFGYSLPLLEIQILLIFTFIGISHMFLRCIGISEIASHILAGLILGPQMLDVMEKSSRKLSMDPALDGNAMLKNISLFGSIMYTLMMTVRTSRRVALSSGKLPVIIGILSYFVPLFSLCFRNFSSDNINPQYMSLEKAMSERILVILMQSAIILPSTTYILLELNILNSELGRLALSASIVTETLGVTFLILGSFMGTYVNKSPVIAYRDFIAMAIFFLVAFLVLKPTMEWIVDRTPEGKPVEKVYVHFVIVTAIASAVYTMFFNMKHFLGPLVIGLVIPEGPPLGSTLEASYEKLTMKVFVPIMITFSAMRCDAIRILNEFNDISFNIFLTLLPFVLKMVACLAPCLYYKLPLKESIAFSIILSYKSFAEFVVYEGSLDESVSVPNPLTIIYVAFSICFIWFAFLCRPYRRQHTHFFIVYTLLNVGIVPTVLRSLYDPKRKYVNYQKRNIFHLEPNSGLRILTCLHKPDNTAESIAFLQLLSSPNLDFPISVTVLHLVKLLGQLNPVLVSQNKKSKRLLNYSYIHTSNLAFKEFMLESLDSVTVTTFTVFSHENLMHEDICTLALDQAASMIIVPLGRKWTVDGMFESDDNAIRHLNQSLLERAPCSIGILIDRGHFSRRSNVTSKRSHNIEIGVIFIGGKDDREALSLVKRMKHNPRAHITVIRLVYRKVIEAENWEYVMDNECLKDVKITEDASNVGYTEKDVTSGEELATVVRLLAGEYDFMVVGRDHGIESLDFRGLTDWVELQELGVIGDMLATRDLSSKASVLVVQHQQQHL